LPSKEISRKVVPGQQSPNNSIIMHRSSASVAQLDLEDNEPAEEKGWQERMARLLYQPNDYD